MAKNTDSGTNLKGELAKIKASVSKLETPKHEDHGKAFRSMSVRAPDSGAGNSETGGPSDYKTVPTRIK